MTEIKQNGLVIFEKDLQENDKLLVILTERYGKLTVVGKGVKSLKNHNMPACQLFCYASFQLRKKGNYYYILDTDVIEPNYEIRNDIVAVSMATYLCDLISFVTAENKEDDDILKLSLNTFFAIAKNKVSLPMIKASFELKLMCLCGFMPDLSGCDVCGEKEPSNLYLDLIDGKITCKNCTDKISFTSVENEFSTHGLQKPILSLSHTLLQCMRYLCDCKIERFLSFKLEKTEQKYFFDVCEKYVLNQLEHHFASLDFYQSLQ